MHFDSQFPSKMDIVVFGPLVIDVDLCAQKKWITSLFCSKCVITWLPCFMGVSLRLREQLKDEHNSSKFVLNVLTSDILSLIKSRWACCPLSQ